MIYHIIIIIMNYVQGCIYAFVLDLFDHVSCAHRVIPVSKNLSDKH